jgi:dCTP deaminase
MILNDKRIIQEVNKENIFISNFDPKRVGPNSYDVTLGKNILLYSNATLSVDENNPYVITELSEAGGFLHPGELYLGVTNEFTHTDKFVMMLEGKSSLARLGLTVHITAGVGDLGFGGHWTLEMSVVKPLKIFPGIPIAQIIFFESEEALIPYDKRIGSANYTINNFNSENPVPQPSKSWKWFDKDRPNLH